MAVAEFTLGIKDGVHGFPLRRTDIGGDGRK